jgi:hypothetical protein
LSIRKPAVYLYEPSEDINFPPSYNPRFGDPIYNLPAEPPVDEIHDRIHDRFYNPRLFDPTYNPPYNPIYNLPPPPPVNEIDDPDYGLIRRDLQRQEIERMNLEALAARGETAQPVKIAKPTVQPSLPASPPPRMYSPPAPSKPRAPLPKRTLAPAPKKPTAAEIKKAIKSVRRRKGGSDFM